MTITSLGVDGAVKSWKVATEQKGTMSTVQAETSDVRGAIAKNDDGGHPASHQRSCSTWRHLACSPLLQMTTCASLSNPYIVLKPSYLSLSRPKRLFFRVKLAYLVFLPSALHSRIYS